MSERVVFEAWAIMPAHRRLELWDLHSREKHALDTAASRLVPDECVERVRVTVEPIDPSDDGPQEAA